MTQLIILSIALIFCGFAVNAEKVKFNVPDVTTEVLKNGSFRAYIPDSAGLKLFAFNGKLNEPITRGEPGTYLAEITSKTGDFWIALFPSANVKRGDILYFWIFCAVDRLGYEKLDLNVTIKDVLDEYPTLKSRCTQARTVLNGQETCVGQIIFSDTFDGPQVVGSKWMIEQWIPTYTAPSFIFNSYLNSNDTRFIKDGILYLQPIAFQSDTDVRGVCDVRNGCTSKDDKECYFRSKSWSLLPPTKSAKITSKMSFKYGRVDIRAKLPAGDWLFPVIRLEQQNKENGENSPVVWIAYSRGNAQLIGQDQDFGARVIYGGPVLYHIEPTRSQHLSLKRSSDPFYEDFHEYSLEWIPGKMTFSVDNAEFGSVDLSKGLIADIDPRGIWSGPDAPFNKEYVVSLGVSVGGLLDFPDGYVSGSNSKPWSNSEPRFIKDFFEKRSAWSSTWLGDNSALKIDYIKVTAV